MYIWCLCYTFQLHRAIFRQHMFKGVYCTVHVVKSYSLRHVIVMLLLISFNSDVVGWFYSYHILRLFSCFVGCAARLVFIDFFSLALQPQFRP
jgi:hypothetical protein